MGEMLAWASYFDFEAEGVAAGDERGAECGEDIGGGVEVWGYDYAGCCFPCCGVGVWGWS